MPLQAAASLLPDVLLPGTVGAVPLRWYKDEDHIGYDLEGKKIIKKQNADALDRLLDRNDSKQVCAFWALVSGLEPGTFAGLVWAIVGLAIKQVSHSAKKWQGFSWWDIETLSTDVRLCTAHCPR